MPFIRLIGLIALLGTALQQSGGRTSYNDWDLSELEARLSEIDRELEELPTLAMRSDSGAIGWRSRSPEGQEHNPHRGEWVQIDLDGEQRIDEIVIVPKIRRDPQHGFQADGFPLAFQIIAGIDKHSDGEVIASYATADKLLPRTAPLVIQCEGLSASWVRIVISELSPRRWDGVYEAELSEVMLFQDGRNIALQRPVSASSSSPGPEYKYDAYKRRNLVDGFVPYMMNGYEGAKSTAYFSNYPIETVPVLTIDLGDIQTLNQINLHAMEVSDTIPQSHPDVFGFPKVLRVEGATKADFSDSNELVNYQMQGLTNRGPILLCPFKPADYRYLRLTVLKTDTTSMIRNTMRGILGLAEIEILSGCENIALGKPVSIDARGFDTRARNTPEALTDGRNFYGNILAFDQWMRQLARRHDLEVERPLIIDALNQGYAQQKITLRIMVYLVAILTSGMVIIYLIGRMRAMRQVAKIRKRFAADLHDELGANLHAIGLLSDLAHDAVDEKEKLQRIVGEVRAVTERTSDAVRYCANSQEARDPIGTLHEDMHRIAKRMMHEMHYKINIEGEVFLQQLKLRTRNDLFLFYKECLANISRHSGATEFSVQLVANAKQLQLTIEDNGQGYTPKPGAAMPPSLERRAQIMRAQLKLERPEQGGTRITLKLKRRSFFLFTK